MYFCFSVMNATVSFSQHFIGPDKPQLPVTHSVLRWYIWCGIRHLLSYWFWIQFDTLQFSITPFTDCRKLPTYRNFWALRQEGISMLKINEKGDTNFTFWYCRYYPLRKKIIAEYQAQQPEWWKQGNSSIWNFHFITHGIILFFFFNIISWHSHKSYDTFS